MNTPIVDPGQFTTHNEQLLAENALGVRQLLMAMRALVESQGEILTTLREIRDEARERQAGGQATMRARK